MRNIGFRTLSLLVLMFMCFGCTSLNIDNMVAGKPVKDVQHGATVAVTASGGSPGVQWFSGTISPEDFRKAIIVSLEKCALFKAIAGEDSCNYILNAEIHYISAHPGFSITGWVKVTWTLVRRVDGFTVWKADIDTEGHAGAMEAFNGAKRQYMAIERAAKENIERALREILDLKL